MNIKIQIIFDITIFYSLSNTQYIILLNTYNLNIHILRITHIICICYLKFHFFLF